jgi:hypothetical protein
VEFELGRDALKRYGVDGIEDWIEKRAAICERLTSSWFRLTSAPVDRKHADRAKNHPLWNTTQAAFQSWCGDVGKVELTPLSKTEIDISKLRQQVVGRLVGIFARSGTNIRDNRQFFLEAEAAIRGAVGVRDMAQEVARRRLEMGMQ